MAVEFGSTKTCCTLAVCTLAVGTVINLRKITETIGKNERKNEENNNEKNEENNKEKNEQSNKEKIEVILRM